MTYKPFLFNIYDNATRNFILKLFCNYLGLIQETNSGVLQYIVVMLKKNKQ